MKRMRKSKFFAYLLTLVLCIGLIPMQSFAAPSETDKYSAGYNVESIFSQFQIFVEEDALLNAHTVGAVAVGGTYTNSNTFGDAAIVPSYIGTYGGGAFGNGWHGNVKNKDIYFGDAAEGVSMQYMEGNWVKNPGYMDMTSAFNSIRTQSSSLAELGTKFSADDIKDGSITLDCSNEYDYFVIPYDVFNSVQHVNIITKNGDVDWFNENACVISIVGVNGKNLAIDNWDKVRINGTHMSTVFELMSGRDVEFGMQLNFSGLNLVFNLPDANGSIEMHGLGGHLVAPNADVYIGYSNYEGGVIAKNLRGESQGHFYPMTKMLGESSDKVRCTFHKRRDSYTGDALKNAQLEITADKSLGNVKRISGPQISLSGDNKTISWTSDYYPLVLEDLPNGNYVMTETMVPDPVVEQHSYYDPETNKVITTDDPTIRSYIKSDPIKFKIESGKIFREISEGQYAEESLTDIVMIDGVKEEKEDAGATCEISKLASDGAGKKDLPGAEMSLWIIDGGMEGTGIENSNGWLGYSDHIDWTTGQLPVKFTNLKDGNYKIVENKAPEGYDKADEITFTVKDAKVYWNDKEVSKIVVVDEKKVETPVGTECVFSKKEIVLGPEIPGAKIEIRSEVDMSSVEKTAGPNITKIKTGNVVKTISWTSGSSPVVLAGFADGDYVMHEEAAPNGYLTTTDINFTIKDGQVFRDNEDTNNLLVMLDKKGAVATFSKKALNVAGDELPGASITITADVDLSSVGQEGDKTIIKNYTADGSKVEKISWISSTKPVTLIGLPDGFYVMHEDAAPNGYLKSTDIYFQIKDGNVLVKDADDKYVAAKDATVTMVDERGADCIFSKKALSEDGAELSGAKITITSNVDMSDVAQTQGPKVTRTVGADKTVKSINWTSTSEPVLLMGLPDGEYKMHEDAAPNGYLKSSDIIFKVEKGVLTVKNDEDEYVSPADETIKMVDKARGGVFSKIDAVTTKELPGAELELKSDDADLSNVTAINAKDANDFSNDNGVLTWVSGDEPLVITMLPAGTYTFTETTAPEGYKKAETVTFEIKDNGDIYVGDTKVDRVVMKDEPKTYEGEFSKTDAVTTNELPGAKLKLTSSDADLSKVDAKNADNANDFKNTNGVITWISGEKPLILTKLPAGTYTFTETTAPEGYDVAETVTFTIAKNGDIYVGDTKVDKIVMEDEPKTYEGTFSKTDAVTTKELPEAKLVLTSDDADLSKVDAKNATAANEFSNDEGVITWTSTNVPLTLTKLPAGTYEFTEITAPEGYEVAETVTFEIKKNGDIYVGDTKVDKVEMKDEPKKYEGEFSKTDAVTTKELPGAKLKLTSSDADLKDVTAKNADDANEFKNTNGVITWTSGSEPLTLTELPAGTYEFTEVTAPKGYEEAETVTFTIAKNGDIYVGDKKVDLVEMKDEPKTNAGEFSKKDKITTNELPGAKLKLTSSDADLKNVTAKNAVKTNEFKNTEGVITWTSTDTPLILTKLPAGTYEFTEIAAPEGYKEAETVTFTIDLDGNFKQNGQIVTQIEMIDAPMAFTGIFSKTDAVTTDELPGAKLKLTSSNANLSGVTASNATDDNKFSNVGGVITWTSTDTPLTLVDLPIGTYEFTETTAPEGYEVAETITFKIGVDGGIYLGDTKVEKIEMKDAPSVFEGTFSKVDAVTSDELPGAKLKLTSTNADLKKVEAKNATDANEFKNTNGVITWTSTDTSLVLSKLPVGTYELTETTAPEGYEVAEKVTFKIDGNGNIFVGNKKVSKVEMKDVPTKKTTDGVFSKTDAATSEELPGAKLELATTDADLSGVTAMNDVTIAVSADGKKITWTSTDKPVILTKLPAGSYSLTETTAPEGYEVAEKITFTVDSKGDMYQGIVPVSQNKIIMKDNPKTYDGEFSKVDAVTTGELAGAKLRLESTDADISNVAAKNATQANSFSNANNVITWISTTTSLKLTNLPAGTYKFTEVTAPKGYEKAETITFTIAKNGDLMQDGKKVDKIVMEDAPITYEKEFSKQSTVTTGELPGAKLILENTDGRDISKVEIAKAAGSDDAAYAAYEFKNANGVISWTSGEAPLKLKNLPSGNYKLTEDTAPVGYNTTTAIEFSIDDNGNLYQNGQKVTRIVMVDEPKTYEAVISKIDIATSDELPGAELKLESTNGIKLNDVTLVKTSGVDESFYDQFKFKNSNGVITWTSGSDVVKLTNLPAGNYKLTENRAPIGYDVAESIEFTIEADGTLKSNGMTVDKIVMEDAPKKYSKEFSKTSAVTSEELPGAALELTRTDGGKLEAVEIAEVDGKDYSAYKFKKSADNKTITWISGTESLKLKNLPAGDYTLTENQAPIGYEITNAVSFSIDAEGNLTVNGKPADKIVMVDEPTTYEKVFSKVDAVTSEELPGAELILESNDGYDLSAVAIAEEAGVDYTDYAFDAEGSVVSWTSGDESLKLKNLPAGNYTLTEITAPDGYAVAESVTFAISVEGRLLVDGKEADKVEMKDAPNKFIKEFSKESAVTSRELPGAKLTLTRTDKGGNLGGVEIAEVDGIDYSAYEFTKSSDKKSVSWISGDESLKIANLPAGSYTLTETTAPDGYLTAESIDFEIDNDGNITQDGQPVDKIVMVDAPILYESIFSKIDAATSNELPGAELQLESKDEDYDLSAVVIAEEDGVDYTDYQFENDGKTITWLSGESPLKLKNLPAGKYTLTENIAPEGYDDAESITFTITGDGKLMVGKKTVDKIVMKDYPEGTTPDEKDTEDDDNDGRNTTENTTVTTTEEDSEDVTTTDEASEEKTTEDEDYDNQTTTEDENYGYDDDDDYPSGNPTTTSVDTTEDQTTADSDSDKTTATTEKTTTDSDKTTATTEKTTSDSDKSTNSTDSQAQTGDDFNGVLPVVAMILAAAGIIICEDRKRKI